MDSAAKAGTQMGKKVQLSGTFRPTSKMRHYAKCRKPVSQSSKAKLIATRTVIGHTVNFYESGEHVIETMSQSDLSDEEMFNSEILRFAHASLISGVGVGDKSMTWVNATKNPVEVWMFGKPIEQLAKGIMGLIKSGAIDPGVILDGETVTTMREITHV